MSCVKREKREKWADGSRAWRDEWGLVCRDVAGEGPAVGANGRVEDFAYVFKGEDLIKRGREEG